MEDIGAPDDIAFMHLRLAELAIRRNDLDGARKHSEWLDQATTDWRPGEVFHTAMMLALARIEGDRTAGDQWYDKLRRTVGNLSAVPPDPGPHTSMQMAALAAYDLFAVAWRTLDVAARCGYPAAHRDARHADRRQRRRGRSRTSPSPSAEHERAAEILGASAAVRGADDPTDPEIIRLTSALRAVLGDDFDPAYDKGRQLSRDEALLVLDPAALQ